MQLELFITLFGLFITLFLIAFVTKRHEIGLISGLYLFVVGLIQFADPLAYKTGLTFSGVNQSIVTYNYTSIADLWINMIGILFIGLSILIMYLEVRNI